MPEFPPSPLLALQQLLLELFDVDEFKWFLKTRLGPEGTELRSGLSWQSLEQATSAAVVAFERRGMIGAGLFDALVAARPGREGSIRDVQRSGDWGAGRRSTRLAEAVPVKEVIAKLERAAAVLREFVEVYRRPDGDGRWARLYELQGEFLFAHNAVRSLAPGGLAREVFDGLVQVMDTARNSRSILTEREDAPRARLLGGLEMSIAYIRACVDELRRGLRAG